MTMTGHVLYKFHDIARYSSWAVTFDKVLTYSILSGLLALCSRKPLLSDSSVEAELPEIWHSTSIFASFGSRGGFLCRSFERFELVKSSLQTYLEKFSSYSMPLKTAAYTLLQAELFPDPIFSWVVSLLVPASAEGNELGISSSPNPLKVLEMPSWRQYWTLYLRNRPSSWCCNVLASSNWRILCLAWYCGTGFYGSTWALEMVLVLANRQMVEIGSSL